MLAIESLQHDDTPARNPQLHNGRHWQAGERRGWCGPPEGDWIGFTRAALTSFAAKERKAAYEVGKPGQAL